MNLNKELIDKIEKAYLRTASVEDYVPYHICGQLSAYCEILTMITTDENQQETIHELERILALPHLTLLYDGSKTGMVELPLSDSKTLLEKLYANKPRNDF